MVFAKMPLAWGNLLPFFCLQLWTSRGSYPSLFPLFLIRYSGCCTFNQHTGLFLQCTIKEPFLCLTPFCSLFWVTCFLSAGCRRKGGNERYSFGLRQKGIVGWDQMVGKMDCQGHPPRGSSFNWEFAEDSPYFPGGVQRDGGFCVGKQGVLLRLMFTG